jgi:hypothetical protein
MGADADDIIDFKGRHAAVPRSPAGFELNQQLHDWRARVNFTDAAGFLGWSVEIKAKRSAARRPLRNAHKTG